MAAGTSYKSLLCVTTDQQIAGRNYPDNRTVWHPFADIVRGGEAGTIWWTDNGPKGTDALTVEPRTFCYKGVATITFTGTSLAVRINVAYNWFNDALVTIDGVAPSTLGLLTAKDVLSSDARDYPPAVELQRYIDVLVADGLTNAEHVCVISVNADLAVVDIDTSRFFSMAGYRVGASTTQLLAATGAWICPLSDDLSHNKLRLTFANLSSQNIYNVHVDFPAGLVNEDGVSLDDLSTNPLKPGQSLTRIVQPAFTGDELSSTGAGTVYDLTVIGEYADPVGVIGPNPARRLNGFSMSMAYEGRASDVINHGDWFYWYHTDSEGESTGWNTGSTLGDGFGFTSYGDTVTIETESGGGRSAYAIWVTTDPNIAPYRNAPPYPSTPTEIGIWKAVDIAGFAPWLAANATLVETVPDPGGAAAIFRHTKAGLGAGKHQIYVVTTQALPIVWYAVEWSSLYTEVAETVQFSYAAQQPIPLHVENIQVTDDGVTFDPPVLGATDMGPQKLAIATYTNFLLPEGASTYLFNIFTTATPHGLARNDVIWLAGADQDYWNGSYVPVVLDATTFTLHAPERLPPPNGNGTLPGADVDVAAPTPIPDGITLQKDYRGYSIRKNVNLAYTEILSRFPTFAVCYQSGFREILGEYDALIIDPIAAASRDVLYWQALNIECYGYIASGEEVGFYSERYNFASALAPNSGSGPGGWAEYYMFTRYGTTGAGWVGTWTDPDKNGVWASYYTNPDPAFGWPARVDNYYAPLVLDGPATYAAEVLTFHDEPGVGRVTDTAHAPIDPDELLEITYAGTTFQPYSQFTFDAKTGAIVMNISTDTTSKLFEFNNIGLAIVNGGATTLAYTRKGHHMEGVFWDVVDTPDVYLSHTFEFGYAYVPGYDTQFITFLNNFKINHPEARMISNRGFTILPQIIANCSGVMFESWLTHPTDIDHLFTTDYAVIDDPAAIAYNEAVNVELRGLRATNVYDCYSLNYCLPGEPGAALREYCATQDRIRGYLSWTSTITLDVPAPNEPVVTVGAPTAPAIPTGPANEFVRVSTVPIYG